MNPLLATSVVTAILLGALLFGRVLHRMLPDHHLSADSKDAVKLAMGLVATMTALLLGLLVSSAKTNYDTQRTQVITMAAKVVFLDRLLTMYGPEAADVRHGLRAIVVDAIRRVWPDETGVSAQLSPDEEAGDALYLALQRLAPRDDTQRMLKTEATGLALDLGQSRTLLQAQAIASVSLTLLVAVVIWLVVIFLSSSVLAPPNATTAVAFVAAVLSVAVAVFLILELDQPFSGMLRISSEPMMRALKHVAS
jgi:hypothetical protein